MGVYNFIFSIKCLLRSQVVNLTFYRLSSTQLILGAAYCLKKKGKDNWKWILQKQMNVEEKNMRELIYYFTIHTRRDTLNLHLHYRTVLRYEYDASSPPQNHLPWLKSQNPGNRKLSFHSPFYRRSHQMCDFLVVIN